MEPHTLIIIITFLILNFVFTSVPVWDFNSLSIDLLGSETSYDYIIYNKTYDNVNAVLTKKFRKTENGITIENILTVNNSESINVSFDDIDSHYHNKLGRSIIICPKGSFHPYDFINREYIIPKGFKKEADWDLRCYEHYTGYFLFFYLNNPSKNVYYYFADEDAKSFNAANDLLDFKLENGCCDQNYRYKFPIIKVENQYIIFQGQTLTINSGENNINYNHYGEKYLIKVKSNRDACFDKDYNFYYFTYNNIYDFISGYSLDKINMIDKDSYKKSVENIKFKNNIESPFIYFDNAKIIEMKFIPGTKYVYYKLQNENNNKIYCGLLDIKLNKILYNIEQDIKANFGHYILISI